MAPLLETTKSPNNVAGCWWEMVPFKPSRTRFMEVIFPADVTRVGFWITQGSNIQLILKDSNNTKSSSTSGTSWNGQRRPVHWNPTRYGRRPRSDDRLRPRLHDRRLYVLEHDDGSGTVEFPPDRDGIDGSNRLAAHALIELAPASPLNFPGTQFKARPRRSSGNACRVLSARVAFRHVYRLPSFRCTAALGRFVEVGDRLSSTRRVYSA